MTTPEGKVRNPVVKWAKGNGFLHVRMSFRPGVTTGFPDDLFVSPAGIHVWLEFKREGKEPTVLQYQKLDRLLKRGVAAFWCDNAAEGIAALQRVLDFSTLALSEATGAPN